MTCNLLESIISLIRFKTTDLSDYNTSYEIGINSEGERLEFYIKDSLSNAFDVVGKADKEEKYSEEFAWLGNQNNPPDIILKQGDAYEIKKTKTASPTIALNSSPPKSVLHSDDPRITADCRNCDGGSWEQKDIYYVMGHVRENILHHLFCVHGKCYAATREVYARVADAIISAVKNVDLELKETVELGRVNRVDPLGITDLRIRGMWQIQHPVRVFNYIYRPLPNRFGVVALLLEEKYLSYPLRNRQTIERHDEISVKKVRVKDPNNPAKRLNAILISHPKQPSLEALK